jgi:hypothetical protein
VPKQRAGILVDEQFSAAILRDARREGLITCCPAEKSGQAEFDIENGPDFARHIEADVLVYPARVLDRQRALLPKHGGVVPSRSG